MNAVLALRNNVHNPVESILTRITRFESAPRDKPDIMDRKYYRIKEPGVTFLEWAVDEYIPLKVGRGFLDHLKVSEGPSGSRRIQESDYSNNQFLRSRGGYGSLL